MRGTAFSEMIAGVSGYNPERMSEMIEVFNREGPEGVLPYFDERVEVFDPDRPGNGQYEGHAGVRRFFSELIDGFEELTVRAEDLVSAGDRVIGLIHAYGRGVDGVEVEIRDAHALTFRDGKVVYWRSYTDRDEALADVGLGEDGTGLGKDGRRDR